MSDKNLGYYTTIEPIRAAWANFYEPTAAMVKGKVDESKKRYNGSFLFKPDGIDTTNIKKTMAAVARAKWPDKPFTNPETGAVNIKFPFKLGEKKAEKAKAKGHDGSFYLGHLVLDGKSQKMPKLAVLTPTGIVQLRTPELLAQYKSKFYHGHYSGLTFNFVAYDGNEEEIKDCVTCYLQAAVWLKDGTEIGGRDLTETFKHYAGTVTAEDPMDDSDGIPF